MQEQIEIKENKWYISNWLERTMKPIKIVKLDEYDEYVSFHFLDEFRRFTDDIERIRENIIRGPFESFEEMRYEYPEYFI